MLLTFVTVLQLPSVSDIALNSAVLTLGGLHFPFSICKMVIKRKEYHYRQTKVRDFWMVYRHTAYDTCDISMSQSRSPRSEGVVLVHIAQQGYIVQKKEMIKLHIPELSS